MASAATSVASLVSWPALAERIGPEIAAFSAGHDAAGSFVQEGFAALKAHGLLKALVPQEFGGGGAEYRAMSETIRTLARHCPSTGLAFSMHAHLLAVPVWRWRHEKAPVEGLLRRVAAEDLVLVSTGGGDWLPSGGVATKVEGGFRIRARKPFASGCPVGDLLMTSAVHEDAEGGPQVLHFAVPFKAEGVRILDSWHAMGMRGTGSHDVVLEDVFVADAGVSARRPVGKWHPLFHAIAMLAFPLVYSAYAGVADAARARALELARGKAAGPDIVLMAGRMENAWTEACLALERMVSIAETATPGVETTARAMTARALTGEAVVRTVTAAMEVVGGTSFFVDKGLERLFRDVQGARFHALREFPQLQYAGRVALGLDVDG